jgi:hypothetical protein
MDSSFIRLHRLPWSPTSMPTRPAAPTLDVPRRVSASASVTTSSHGLRSGNTRYLAPAPRLGTVLWPTPLPRLLGFANSSTSFIDHLLQLRLCSATMSAPSTCQRTPSSTIAPNTSRSIFTLSVIMLRWVRFACYMFRRLDSSPTS